MKVGDILGKPIVVTGYEINKSKKNEGYCLKLQFYLKDDKNQVRRVIFSGSTYLIRQVQTAAEEERNMNVDFGFETIIRSNSGYYSFT